MQGLLQIQGPFSGICSPPRGKRWKHSPVATVTQQGPRVSLGEVASFALCKPGGMGRVVWQVQIRKVVQCRWQLFGLVTAQTFLKGLSKSWRSLELPSCERQVLFWAACCLLRMSSVFYTHPYPHPLAPPYPRGYQSPVIDHGSYSKKESQGKLDFIQCPPSAHVQD